MAAVRASDAVVRTHYSDIGPKLVPHTLVRDQWLYTSYRVGHSVYWTKRKVRVRAGETVLTTALTSFEAAAGTGSQATPGNRRDSSIRLPIIEDQPVQAMDYAAPEMASSEMPPDGGPLDILIDLPGDDSDQSRLGDPNLTGDRGERAPGLPASHPAVLYPHATDPSHFERTGTRRVADDARRTRRDHRRPARALNRRAKSRRRRRTSAIYWFGLSGSAPTNAGPPNDFRGESWIES